jgi:hypothetical protein
MKNLFLITIAVMFALNLFSQQRIDAISISEKTETVYKFSLTGKNLDSELNKLNEKFGEPTTSEPGKIIWTNIEISNIGQNLQIEITDGLLTIKNDKAKYKHFKKSRNKNKSKNCKLKCLEENEYRQLVFTITENERNIINNKELKEAAQKYLSNII